MPFAAEAAEAHSGAQKRRAIRPIKHKGIGIIYDAFKKAENIPFLKGENKRGWKADFDWLLKGDNLEHVLEGRYNHSENCTDDSDMDKSFVNQHAYTKEQFAAMNSNIFDLKEL